MSQLNYTKEELDIDLKVMGAVSAFFRTDVGATFLLQLENKYNLTISELLSPKTETPEMFLKGRASAFKEILSLVHTVTTDAEYLQKLSTAQEIDV